VPGWTRPGKSPVRYRSQPATIAGRYTCTAPIPSRSATAPATGLPSINHLPSWRGEHDWARCFQVSPSYARLAFRRDQRAREMHFSHASAPSLTCARHAHCGPVWQPGRRYRKFLITSLSAQTPSFLRGCFVEHDSPGAIGTGDRRTPAQANPPAFATDGPSCRSSRDERSHPILSMPR
jgi:hypothetical protein